jgi:hypothetical protein
LESKPAPTGADEYWIKATMAEAYAGLGDDAKAEELLEAVRVVDMSVPPLDSQPKTNIPGNRVEDLGAGYLTMHVLRHTPIGQARVGRTVPPVWMVQTTVDQLGRLRDLLAKSPLNRVKLVAITAP